MINTPKVNKPTLFYTLPAWEISEKSLDEGWVGIAFGISIG